jgi:type I restriction enzyme M protein
MLHGIGSDAAHVPVPGEGGSGREDGEYDMVLTNPPFGKKSSVTVVKEAGETSKKSLIINRDDFWASISTVTILPACDKLRKAFMARAVKNRHA